MIGEQLYSFDRDMLRWLGAALGTGVVLLGAVLLAESNRVCRLRHLAARMSHVLVVEVVGQVRERGHGGGRGRVDFGDTDTELLELSLFIKDCIGRPERRSNTRMRAACANVP